MSLRNFGLSGWSYYQGGVDMQYNITYRQKDKGWQYIVSYKDGGVWRQKSRQCFETRKKASLDADVCVKELEKKLEFAEALDPEYEGIDFKTFSDNLIEHERLYKEANTTKRMSAAIEAFEGLRKIKLADIKHGDVQRCVDALVKQGLKVSTIKMYLSTIVYIFNQAVDPYKVIPATPVIKIKLPTETMEEAAKEVRALTKNETDDLMAKLKEGDFEYYVFSLLALTTGLRIGEILGLTWTDIDMANAILDVNKQWKILKSGEYGFGKLKRKNSYRQVPIPPRTISSLAAFKRSEKTVNISNRLFPYDNNNYGHKFAFFACV
jgi:integrase